ncbi:MAG: hypothetical protein ACI4ST_07695, partial [Candidatus Gallimonas sp.]
MKKFFKQFCTGAFALVLSLSLAACGVASETGTDGDSTVDADPAVETYSAYLAVDINPSVEFVIEDGEVVSVRAANDDASVLLTDEDFAGLTVEEAVKKLVELAEELGFLTDSNRNVKITVVADGEERTKQVEEAAKSGAQKGSGKAEINFDPRVEDERVLEKLKEEHPGVYDALGAAKLRLIESIMKYDETMTYEEGAEMTIEELSRKLKELTEEYRDMVTEDLENKFETAYEEAKAELERQIAELYGEEYLTALDTYNALKQALEEIEEKAENTTVSEEDIAALMELLGITDRTLLEKDGVVRPESVEKYIDKNVDKRFDPETFELKRAVWEILEKYDEENYVLTEEDLAALTAAAGETVEAVTLKDAERLLETKERELNAMRFTVKLTE